MAPIYPRSKLKRGDRSWKDDYRALAYTLLSHMNNPKAEHISDTDWRAWLDASWKTAWLLINTWSWDGIGETPLKYAWEDDGPVIVSYPTPFDSGNKPNTTIRPEDILAQLEQDIIALKESPAEEGPLRVFSEWLRQIRVSWFCAHMWVDGSEDENIDYQPIRGTKEDAGLTIIDGKLKRKQYCPKCGNTREIDEEEEPSIHKET